MALFLKDRRGHIRGGYFTGTPVNHALIYSPILVLEHGLSGNTLFYGIRNDSSSSSSEKKTVCSDCKKEIKKVDNVTCLDCDGKKDIKAKIKKINKYISDIESKIKKNSSFKKIYNKYLVNHQQNLAKLKKSLH